MSEMEITGQEVSAGHYTSGGGGRSMPRSPVAGDGAGAASRKLLFRLVVSRHRVVKSSQATNSTHARQSKPEAGCPAPGLNWPSIAQPSRPRRVIAHPGPAQVGLVDQLVLARTGLPEQARSVAGQRASCVRLARQRPPAPPPRAGQDLQHVAVAAAGNALMDCQAGTKCRLR